jgi:cytochrome c biogenesis protein
VASRRPSNPGALQPVDLADSTSDFDSPDAPRKNRLDAQIRGPKLGPLEFVRWVWRVLTSMRTAIILLVLVAFASIPGSLVPQRSSDPNGVIVFRDANPELFQFYESIQLFDTFTSVWFSSIYLLLFISLIGCIVPRTLYHWRILRAEPAAEPASWVRLPFRRSEPATGGTVAALDRAEVVLRAAHYRVVRNDTSIRAEFGYLRETGNLVFHVALVGILATLAVTGGYGWSGQRVIIEGQTFTNQLASYDSFNPGSWFTEQQLEPYGVTLDSFTPEYTKDPVKQVWMPIDFTANVSVTEGDATRDVTLKVNEPLVAGNSQMYLLGNGYAPVITVRDPQGNVVFDQPVVFLSQDANLTSVGVVKVPDGLSEQIGMQGFFYPSAIDLDSGALSSNNPEPTNPTVTFNIYTGDLGLDSGATANVFQLPVESLTQIAGRHTGTDVVLTPGDVFELPGGLGSIEFTSLRRFIGVEIRNDPTQFGVALSTFFIVTGLLASLGTRRRRVWIRVSGSARTPELEWGGMARGDDPRLDAALDRLVDKTRQTPTGKVARE